MNEIVGETLYGPKYGYRGLRIAANQPRVDDPAVVYGENLGYSMVWSFPSADMIWAIRLRWLWGGVNTGRSEDGEMKSGITRWHLANASRFDDASRRGKIKGDGKQRVDDVPSKGPEVERRLSVNVITSRRCKHRVVVDAFGRVKTTCREVNPPGMRCNCKPTSTDRMTGGVVIRDVPHGELDQATLVAVVDPGFTVIRNTLSPNPTDAVVDPGRRMGSGYSANG
ncbi:hypothetical protein BDM02DRAFT_3131008 [Thelephora ganbajun]|uniref:Uncharacterized protein n=1 Tax=Thelephora ganbajun TaxID=370292 RepID=A0ACB6Z7J6_THEGA|nr:hypothetical protein BDM02DRAFT_3131008 [Thelephora ganbajun]